MSEWKIPEGSRKKACKRKGRGSGSGNGKTAGKGHKGQRARAGAKPRVGFEGGQTPIYRRLPKRGFNNIFKKDVLIVNISQLALLPEDVSSVTPKELWTHGLISCPKKHVKILGQGELSRAMTVQVHGCSKSARTKIEASGGQVQGINLAQ